jgi:hypothetical protein
MLPGILLPVGTLGSSKQRLAVLEQDANTGAIVARPRTLRELSRAVTEQASGETTVNARSCLSPGAGRGDVWR